MAVAGGVQYVGIKYIPLEILNKVDILETPNWNEMRRD